MNNPFTVTYMIRGQKKAVKKSEPALTTTIDVPQWLYDEDADRPEDMPEEESPLHKYLLEQLRVIDEDAVLLGYEPKAVRP